MSVTLGLLPTVQQVRKGSVEDGRGKGRQEGESCYCYLAISVQHWEGRRKGKRKEEARKEERRK